MSRRLPVLAIFTACALCLLHVPTLAQNVTLPASKTDQVVYVANAIYHMDLDNGQEKTALAKFVLKVYERNPNAHPGIIERQLISAQEQFDLRYKSVRAPQSFRFLMSPFDIMTNMYNLLATTPGNPVASEMLGESVGFVMRTGYRLGEPTDWMEMSNALGRARVSGGYEQYRGLILEDLHTLARSNMYAAEVVRTFFQPYFHASPAQTARQILDANTSLRDSVNFAPINAMIQPNGTLVTTLTNSRDVMRGFQNRMEEVVDTNLSALHQVNLLQTNYAASFIDPNSVLQMQTIRDQARGVNAPRLEASSAVTYITPLTIEPDPEFTNYVIATASLRVAAGAAELTGEILSSVAEGAEGNVVGVVAQGFQAASAGLELAALTMDLAAAGGAYGPSDEEVIMDGINQLSGQLQAVQMQMNERLDRLDRNLATLYDTMNAQFEAVNEVLQDIQSTLADIEQAVRSMQYQVLNVQSSIDRLTQNIFLFEQQSGRETLKTYLSEIDLYARSNLPISLERYIEMYNLCQRFSVDNCRNNQSEIGEPVNNREYDDYSMDSELGSANSNPEWNINYMMEFARVRFNQQQYPGDSAFSLISPLITPGSNLANPKSWEMSAAGMLRIATHQPDHFAATTINDTASNARGFFGTRNVGRLIQQAVANCTLIGTNRSPLFANLLLHYGTPPSTSTPNGLGKAAELRAALIALENEGGTLADKVQRIRTQWTAPSPTANGLALQNAVRALNGSKKMLERFIQFGLSRTLERHDLLKSLLFSDQKLPDAALVQNLYLNWTASSENPRLTFERYWAERHSALSEIITNSLDEIAANAQNGSRIGEPISSIEAMLLRMEAITMVRVSGKVRPATGAFVTGDPITLTFRGVGRTFVVPVLLDAQGNFTVSLPDDNYQVLAKGRKFLQKKFDLPISTRDGNIPSTNNNVIIDMPLLVGDSSGDNVVDNRDLIILRNAWGSTRISRNWNPLADLNGDNAVNQADLNLLKTNWGRRGDQ